MFCLRDAMLGNTDKAYELFVKIYKQNEVPPFGVLAETAGGTDPYFAMGAGGMLRAIIAGFGGLRITDQGMVQEKTNLPARWKSIGIKGAGADEKSYITHQK